MSALTFDRILAAEAVIAGRLPPSPLLQAIDASLVGELWLKCESLQPTGSFKIRGATYRISRLGTEEKRAGVVAYSTGNHAQAVAKAASDAGIAATIVMSPDVPVNKVRATERWGARVVMAEASSHARRAKAEQIAADTRATLIPPYNDFEIMAGQGTIACELSRQLPDLHALTVFVPVGGGGLLAGVATGMKALDSSSRVIGVEPEWEADAAASFRSGRIVTADGPSSSVADAIKVQAIGELTFPSIQAFVDDIVTVREDEIVAAVLELFALHRLVVEPGGAVAYAAAVRAARSSAGRRVALLCGGNISLEQFRSFGADAR